MKIEIIEGKKRKVRVWKRKAAKGKKRRSKARTPAQLKRELDRVFSLFIRAKYAKECYTCRAKGKTLQCGHFISRTYLATRWDENNCRPQCVGCNIWGRGKPLDFEERLKEEIGAEMVELMKKSRKGLIKINRAWYEGKTLSFKEKLASLAS